MSINEYFGRVYVISLRRRLDRRIPCAQELANSGIDPMLVEWVEGIDDPENGNRGCSQSHRWLLHRIANGDHERVLILEDDFKVLTRQDLIEGGFTYKPCPVMDTFRSVLNGNGNLAERFEALIPFLPEAFDVLYLAAGYGEPPIYRLNKHVLRVGFMQTTSTYGITREFARVLSGSIPPDAIGPIDNLFGALSHEHRYYCVQPRLAFQRASKSDLNGNENSSLMSMTDPAHEALC